MNSVLTDLATNAQLLFFIGVASLAFGVLGIVLAYVFYVRGKRTKQLSWSRYSAVLITDYSALLGGLSITYDGHPVADLTVTRIILWNSGSDEIDASDLTTLNPLRIVSKAKTEILRVTPLAWPRGSNVELPGYADGIRIVFDYLNSNRGIVFQIVHTGKSGASVQMTGDVRGIEALRKVAFPVPRFISSVVFRIPEAILRTSNFVWGTFLAGVLGLLIFAGTFILTALPNAQGLDSKQVSLARYSALLVSGVYFWLAWRSARQRAPAELEQFADEIFPNDDEER